MQSNIFNIPQYFAGQLIQGMPPLLYTFKDGQYFSLQNNLCKLVREHL